MNEKLLQFIWQFQYFNTGELETTDQERLQILKPGFSNQHQGPDFTDAKIKIHNTHWAGNIEIHVCTSDWLKHGHQNDSNYNNVILHVVWKNDIQFPNIPVLELCNRVPGLLLQKYKELMNQSNFIPCESNLQTVHELTWKNWKTRLVAERLERRGETVTRFLGQNNYHWEETYWSLLARNFGYMVNADAFESIARSIPVKILARHRNNILQTEALLIGQAGLLEKAYKDDYPLQLKDEYVYLKKKYKLKTVHIPLHFLRMRPGNFPTLRLSQLAMLVTRSHHHFSKIIAMPPLAEVIQAFDVAASEYWDSHYRFDQSSRYKKKKIGPSMIRNIIINTLCPVFYAYGDFHNDSRYKDRAIGFLEQTKAEINTVLKKFMHLGLENKTAFDSQSLMELKKQYCNLKNCLNCSIGNSILRAY
ncbi:MAG: DUF2851 family protein [Terrimonas sp.]|nr:DUF2851 family protein [Terrimonas sp.]